MMLLPFPTSYIAMNIEPTSTSAVVVSAEPSSSDSSRRSSDPDQRPARCAELCAVCGDQSTGYHYEVPSCNGCKTFFRRTIVSERVFKCHKDGNCRFTKDIRCACRCCRFKKCLEVGMNPKAIQGSRTDTVAKEPSPATSTSPDPTSRKRAYYISSLLDMPASCSTMSCSEPRSSNASRSVSPIEMPITFKSKYEEKDMATRIEKLLALEDRLDTLKKSNAQTPTSLLDILTKPCALEHLEKYEAGFVQPLDFAGSIERETFLIVEYVKQFGWFRELGFADKYALLCDRIPYLLTLRLAAKSATERSEIINSIIIPCTEVLQRLECDRTTFALLNILILLDTDTFSLSTETRDMLAAERRPYVDCLAAYLFQKHHPSGAARTAEYFSLMWTVLRISPRLRQTLTTVLPAACLTRQLIDITSAV